MKQSTVEKIFKLPLMFSRFFQLFIGRVLGTILSIILMLLLSTIFLEYLSEVLPAFIMHNVGFLLYGMFSNMVRMYLIIGCFIAIIPEYSYKKNLYKRN